MKIAAAFLALVAVAATLVGCGAQSVLDPVAAAATKTQNAGGAKVSMRLTVDAPVVGSTVVTAEGAFDQQQGELTLDLSDVLAKLPTQLPAGDGQIKTIYTNENGDPVVYVGASFLANALSGGKHWIRVDLAHAASAAGVDLSQILGQAGGNPTDVLAMLRASGEVTTVGPDTVDGTAVTHYRATIDLDKALSQKGIPHDAVQRLLDSGAPTTLPVDVWIGDDDGLVRQVETTYSATTAAGTASAALSLKLSDWGTTVSVETPPAGQVFEAN
jgi:hypothetical protein